MDNGKSTGNWSLRLGNWTVSTQMEIGLENFSMVFLYRVIHLSETVSAVKIKTVSIISNFFFNLYFGCSGPVIGVRLNCYWTRGSSYRATVLVERTRASC